jgi:hypothetical protein
MNFTELAKYHQSPDCCKRPVSYRSGCVARLLVFFAIPQYGDNRNSGYISRRFVTLRHLPQWSLTDGERQ